MTDKDKYDFIDHVVHLTLFEEDRLLNEHGGDYDGLEEDGIDSNEYYRIITERVINTLKKNNNYMQDEPVSEDLESEIQRYYVDWDEHPEYVQTARHFAKWQKEQFEKERLKHCDALTEEQAQIESDFVTKHLKENNRTPTFIDAIEYGMRLKEKEMQSTIELAEDHAMLAGMEKMREQMMANAVEGKVLSCEGLSFPVSNEIHRLGLEEGDKVKVIILKDK